MPQTATSLNPTPLPRAIVRQSKRVAELLESQNPNPAIATPPANDAAIVVEEPSPPAPQAPAAPAADPRESDPNYWRQRFNVTQGMLEKERRDRVADQQAFQRDTDQLRVELRTAKQSQTAAPADIDLTKYFTPEQIEQYGEEQCKTLAKVADRVAREQTQSAIAEHLQPIQAQREQDAQATERERTAKFYDTLAAEVPDYEAVNATDGWKEWLSVIDEPSGYQRQDLLQRHAQVHDAGRVARMFNEYKATLKAPTAPPVAVRSGGGPAQAPAAPDPLAAKGYPSKAEIKAFWTRAATKRRGQPGFVTDQERAEFEARCRLPQPAA